MSQLGFLETIARTRGPRGQLPAIPLWSSVYNNVTGEWWLVWSCHWNQVYRLTLPMVGDADVPRVRTVRGRRRP